MLNWRVKLLQHRQALGQSLLWLSHKPLATLCTMGVIALTLSLPLLVEVFAVNLSELTVGLRDQHTISLYLKQNLPSGQDHELLQRVQALSAVKTASLISPAEGLAALELAGLPNLMQYLPINPLPAVIEVIPQANHTAPVAMESLLRLLQALPNVEQAQLDMQWVNRVYSAIHLAIGVAHGLMLLLASAVVLIITNTLRLSIHMRRQEIEVLKLVGAPDSFVLRPFIYAGMLYSLGGAILALLAVSIFFLSLDKQLLMFIQAFQANFMWLTISWGQVAQILLFALLLGWCAARFIVKRHLSNMEPSV